MIVWFIPLFCLASPGADAPADRFTLSDGTVVEGLLLTRDGANEIVELFEPWQDKDGIIQLPKSSVTDAKIGGNATDGWRKRYAWYAAECEQRKIAPKADETAQLADMLDHVEQSEWRPALVGFKKLQRGKSTAALSALDPLVHADTGQTLPELLVDVELHTAIRSPTATTFSISQRATIEAPALAGRLEEITNRLIETPVPTTGTEDFERLVFPIGGLTPIAPGATPTPVVNPDITREHSIRAWISDPAGYDADPEAARVMLRRIAFALGVTREWREVAASIDDDTLEGRVLDLRARLAALQDAVKRRSKGKLTPEEQEEIRQSMRDDSNPQRSGGGGGGNDDGRRERRGRDPSDRGRDPSDRGRDPR